MKLILKNSTLVFAKNIENLTIDIEPTSGSMYYWIPSNRETINWNEKTTNSKYQCSQVVNVDRNRYNKFKIVVPNDVEHTPTHFWLAFAGGSKGQTLYQASPTAATRIQPNTVYDFANSDVVVFNGIQRTFDAQLNSIENVSNEKVCSFAISLKLPNTDSTQEPYMEAVDFAKIQFVLMP